MIEMFEVSKIYIRSVVGIVSMTAAICYLNPQDATVLGGYMAAVIACVLLDKGAAVE